MASKKQTKKRQKKAQKSKSKKPSLGKARSKVLITRKSKKLVKSKKSSKVGISKKEQFTLVTLNAKTRKVITPKKGQQVFFAWKSSQGKIYPIESQYSQTYYKSDAEGIIRAFKAGAPEAYNVYKELTHDVSTVIDSDGNRVKEFKIDKEGNKKPLYRWKVTGRNVRQKQSVSVRSIKRFRTPLTIGFPSSDPKDIPIGHYNVVPVARKGKKVEPTYVGRFTGDSIRDTLEKVLPDSYTEDLVKRRVKSLIVDCLIKAHRPENPYLEDTTDGEEWERWANKVWPKTPVRDFSVSLSVSTLMNFASVVSTGIRQLFSSQGLRVTSLVALENNEKAQKRNDQTIFKTFQPWWQTLIQRPPGGVRYKLSAPGKGGQFVPANKYFPLRYEGGTKEALQQPGEKYATILELWLHIKEN